MAGNEKKFSKDIENAVKPWRNVRESSHEDGGFNVKITIEDGDEWADNNDLIWKALDIVREAWGALLDESGIQEYTMSIPADKKKKKKL